MLQEIRNQNHAIFKHADHNRILSGKLSNEKFWKFGCFFIYKKYIVF